MSVLARLGYAGICDNCGASWRGFSIRCPECQAWKVFHRREKSAMSELVTYLRQAATEPDLYKLAGYRGKFAEAATRLEQVEQQIASLRLTCADLTTACDVKDARIAELEELINDSL